MNPRSREFRIRSYPPTSPDSPAANNVTSASNTNGTTR